MVGEGGGRPVGLRELKRDRTRHELITAARARFADVGYREARTADIARAALVAEGTLFRYFGSKADLALAGVGEVIQRALDEFCGRPGSEPVPVAVRATIRAVADDGLLTGPAVVGEIALLLEHREIQSRLMGLISEARGQITPSVAERLGVAPDAVAAELVARSLLGAVLTAIRRWFAAGGDGNPFDILEDCVAHLDPILQPVGPPVLR